MVSFLRYSCKCFIPLALANVRSVNVASQLFYSNIPSLYNSRCSINLPRLLSPIVCKISASPVRKYANDQQNPEKLSLVAKFKQMYRDYWYVLVPVHLVTSVFWFGSFYYLAKSGVDVIALLKSMGISERFTDHLKDSSMGYYALAYGLYKIATPVRYTITLGGTTISIKYLQDWGYIKPIPSKEKLKEMYQEKKEGLQDIYQETKQELKQRKHIIKGQKDNIMSDIAKYKQEMKETKENELKSKS